MGMGKTGSSIDDQDPDEYGRWSIPAKEALILTVLTRRASAAQAAAVAGVAESELAAWVRAFLEGGKAGLRHHGRWHGGSRDSVASAGRTGAELANENRVLRVALAETRARAQSWQRAAEGTPGPSATLR